MKNKYPSLAKARLLSSRLAPFILLFQRSPLVQALLPEARLAGGAGIGKLAGWTIATVVGLGAYDSVAGATTLKQLLPKPGAKKIKGKVDTKLSFVFQITGTESSPKSWQIIGKLPKGLNHTNSTGKTIDSITGVPTQAGTFRITVKAWEHPNNKGKVHSQTFIMVIHK